MSSSAYPVVQLPEFGAVPAPEGGSEGAVAKAWAESLPALGFSLLFEAKYVSLEDRLNAEADLLVRRARHGKHAEPSSRPLRKMWYQWWRHPDGVIAVVDRYESGSKTWLFNKVQVIANIDGGYGQDQSPTRFAADGSGVFVLAPSNMDDMESKWRQIRAAGASGHLIPLAKWPILGQQRGLLERQEWTFPMGRLSQALLETPAKRYQHAHRMRRRHLAGLIQPWKQNIEQSALSTAEKRLWMEALAMEAGNASIPVETGLSAPSYGPLPAWARRHLSTTRMQDFRKEMNHEKSSRALNQVLADFGLEEKHGLSWEERAVAAQWLATLEDLRHPRCQEQALKQAFSTSIGSLGLRFEHVLFRAAPQMRSALGKLAWWQARKDPVDLARLCTSPDRDGLTLPMRWMRIWLEVLNQRVDPRESLHRRTHARRSLDNLAQAVAPESWALSTNTRSMWDPALGHAINLPMDQDLVGEHRACLLDLLSWLEEKQLPTPSDLVLTQDMRLDLLAPSDLAAQLDRGYSQVAGTLGSGLDRAQLLAPITVHLQRQALERASPMPRSKSPPPRAARL